MEQEPQTAITVGGAPGPNFSFKYQNMNGSSWTELIILQRSWANKTGTQTAASSICWR